jgi:hypothetical protein
MIMAENNSQLLEDTVIVPLEVGYKDEDGTEHKEAEIREITGLDEETISKAEIRQNIGKLITTLLASVTVRIGDVTPKSIGSRAKWEKIFRELPLGDRDKLMLEVRKHTNGDEIELDMKCPHCKSKILHVVEIEQDIEERPLEVDASAIPFELPKGIKNKDGELCTTGTIRLPNGIDQEQLDTIARKNAGMANTTLLSRAIVSLDGFGQVTMNTLRKMTVRDRDYLIKLLGESSYGPKFEISFPCPSCGEDLEAGVNPVNFL